jgi:glucose/arabinose dehydrogenase
VERVDPAYVPGYAPRMMLRARAANFGRPFAHFLSPLLPVVVALGACSTGTRSVPSVDASFGDASPRKGDASPPQGDARSHVDARAHTDATVAKPDAHAVIDADLPDVNRGEAPGPMTDFCKLPGSVVWNGGLPSVVAGGGTLPDLTWMRLPDGYCSHYYAAVPETRQLRFSPSGDLFVASPSATCAGGASGGMGAVVVLPDDNHDGVADGTTTFLASLPSTEGLLFTGGYLYYQDGPLVRRMPYTTGERVATGTGEQVVDVSVYSSNLHWPKALDADDNGNVFVTNGGDNGEACEGAGAPDGEVGTSRPFHGGILQIDGTPNGKLVARGLRNPIAIRCAKGTGTCFGLELALDFAAQEGSREKLFPIHQGDDWGFPCCATANEAYSAYTNPVPDCSGVAAEDTSFLIDHTPFGLDFEEGSWTGDWKFRAFVALHGIVGSWVGARVVGIATDARTGWPVMTAETDAGSSPTMTDFATGWDDGQRAHGRPAAITFAPDGRMFIGNDIDGSIVWIAPVTSSGS